MVGKTTSYNGSAVWLRINDLLPAAHRTLQWDRPTEATLSWRNCAIHVDHYDNPASPVRVILHHGLGTNARLMSMILGRSLAKRGYDVAAIDMPYVGMSMTSSSNFTYDDWVQLSHEFILNGLRPDPRPVVLFGFSVGGMLCYHASCLTDRVIGICGTCFLDLRSTLTRREIARSPFWSPVVEAAGRIAVALGGHRLKVPLRLFANPIAISNNPMINRLLARDPGAVGAKIPLGFLASLKTYQPQIEPEKFDKCPVMLIHCEQDRNIPFSANARFVGRIKGPRETKILKDAGHIPTTEAPLRELSDDVERFIGSLFSAAYRP